ncbi:MAG: glycosyltransferase family 2 protein [Anaerolineaceae bacterium]|nr:glycosyltransferase family 2 protein [Anaerolineaceae bacterium]
MKSNSRGVISKKVQVIPTVSIIIPTYNEEAYINNCLDSILNQDYPGILDIYIIDGDSIDGTKAIVGDFFKEDPRIILINNTHRYQTSALNLGINKSKGDIIVRIDAHAIYASNYVSECVLAFERSHAGCVGGGVNLLPGEDFLSKLIGLVQKNPLGSGIAKFRRQSYEGYVDTVWPGAYHRSIFEKVGYFREYLTRTEDLDFHARMRQMGYSIYQTPRIKPYYHPRTGLLSLFHQYFGNGQQVITTLVVNAEAISLRHLVPLITSTLFALSLIFGMWNKTGIFISCGFAGLYLAFLLLASISIGINNGIKYFFTSPLIFAVIHISYALGSWSGLFLLLSNCFNVNRVFKENFAK